MSNVLAPVEVQRRRFTVEEYYQMAEVGILGPEDHVENPVRLLRDAEPQSDVVLLRPPLRRDWEHKAEPPDALLVVEIADTSYRYDRRIKLPLYARVGIPEVWIVDLAHAVVEVFREPREAGYAFAQRVERGGMIAPAALPDAAIAVTEILPPA